MAERPAEERPRALPPELAALLSAGDERSANLAWDRFLEAYGDLVLRTARRVNRDHDSAMDAYAHVLEQLHEQDFARLRKFSGGSRENLSAWIVVVARRMCMDLHRRRYGRTREHTPERERLARKRLTNELWENREPTTLPDAGAGNPEMDLRTTELSVALGEALESLEPPERLLLELRFDNGLSARRIAEILDFPSPFHVYRKLKQVLEGLREHLEHRGFADSEP